ncbi:MAG: 5-dehydro-2-deoxygluconokinase [Waddliaceae bacterium]|nr:5-dehydro-2-deoxygluconokinase [Waddliaceae bacterium]
MSRSIDIICMGRAAVDLYSDQLGAPIRSASSFSKYVGGCPANIAIGSSRLGLKTAILSCVGSEQMGEYLRQTFIEEGVDVSMLRIVPERLSGLVLLGVQPPKNFPLIFYREHCADMALKASDCCATTFAQSKALLITGTHCSTESTYEATCHAVNLAKNYACKVVLDIDYRPVLWGETGHADGEARYSPSQKVAEKLAPLLSQCDLIVGTEEELRIAVGENDINQAIQKLRLRTQATIVQKKGEEGCIVHEPGNINPIIGPSFSVNILNVLGAGDAFLSGFLRAWLREMPLEECCTLANANGALVVSRHGCAPAMPYWQELQNYLSSYPNSDLHKINHLHLRMNRRRGRLSSRRDLCILAWDHRDYFSQIADRFGHSEEEIRKFKKMIYSSWRAVFDEEDSVELGVIIDDEFASDILCELKDNVWCAKPLERSGYPSLAFLDNREASSILRHWPQKQRVKLLCQIAKVGDETAFNRQIEKIRCAYEACLDWGQELILELIPQGNENERRSIYEAIQTLYSSGIYPDWWKLPHLDKEGKIEKLIQSTDPYCRGVLILGQCRTLEEMETVFAQTQKSSLCKGFAIGRSIWASTAELWFSGQISDEHALINIRNRFQETINIWNAQKNRHSSQNQTTSKVQ